MALVTPELGLVPEDILITPLRVETQHLIPQIMDRYIKAMGYILVPWVPRLRAIGLLHKEAYPP